MSSKTKRYWAFLTGLHLLTFYDKRHQQRNNVKIIEPKMVIYRSRYCSQENTFPHRHFQAFLSYNS